MKLKTALVVAGVVGGAVVGAVVLARRAVDAFIEDVEEGIEPTPLQEAAAATVGAVDLAADKAREGISWVQDKVGVPRPE